MTRARDLTTCRDCHRQWIGRAECHCVSCHLHFGSESAFARHTRDGQCLSASELLEGEPPRLVATGRKFGVTLVRSRKSVEASDRSERQETATDQRFDAVRSSDQGMNVNSD